LEVEKEVLDMIGRDQIRKEIQLESVVTNASKFLEMVEGE
jgi:hypothetical protein